MITNSWEARYEPKYIWETDEYVIVDNRTNTQINEAFNDYAEALNRAHEMNIEHNGW